MNSIRSLTGERPRANDIIASTCDSVTEPGSRGRATIEACICSRHVAETEDGPRGGWNPHHDFAYAMSPYTVLVLVRLSACQNLIAGKFGLALYILNLPRPVESVRAPQAPVLGSLKEVCEFDIL